MIETWKDIPNYEGLYQVSDLGNVKSLANNKSKKEKLLKFTTNAYGYYHVNLSKNGKVQTITVHILVAMAFLNHIPNGINLVVNHKDFNTKNNKLSNLEVVTHRINCDKKHLKSKSKYTGVSWYERYKKWKSTISVKGERIHLGYFNNEYDAHIAYENYLNKLKT